MSRGWKKRAGQIFTQDLDGEFFAWLGLNRASKYHPLEVHPVIGVGHEPATVLEARLRGVPPGRTPILSEPLVYLGPSGKRMAELRISGLAEVGPVVARLIELVERSGLPFARPLATRDAMVAALRGRKHLAVDQYALTSLPAVLASFGSKAEAREAMAASVVELGERSDPAAADVRRFADALSRHLDG
ncbi:MAG TPA: hypothetical protein VK698_29945 [Kofleriaceae bacterium]|nr:hypothetical protein [Kofleriaceae bacterium]